MEKEKLTDYICFGMRAAMKKIDKHLSHKMETYGISIPQSFILYCLQDENGLTLKEIGSRALIDSSSMTVLVDKLEKEALVERRLDPQDRRAIRVYITERGEKITKELLEITQSVNMHLMEILGKDGRTHFIQGLNSIIDEIE